MTEIGWDTSYNIEIKHISPEGVFHLGTAVKKYLATIPMPSGNDDVVAELQDVLEVCETITRKDDED